MMRERRKSAIGVLQTTERATSFQARRELDGRARTDGASRACGLDRVRLSRDCDIGKCRASVLLKGPCKEADVLIDA
jgi:hypothetical protein